MGGQPDANGHADTPSFSWGWRYASTLFRAYVVSLKHESRIWCLMMGGMKLHISCSSLSSQFPLQPRPPIPNQSDWQKRMCKIFTHHWNGQRILLLCFTDTTYGYYGTIAIHEFCIHAFAYIDIYDNMLDDCLVVVSCKTVCFQSQWMKKS